MVNVLKKYYKIYFKAAFKVKLALEVFNFCRTLPFVKNFFGKKTLE